MLSRRPILLVPLFACAAWLLGYAVNVVAFAGADLGPLSSRFAHDVVLAVAAGICLTRGALAARERCAWLLIGAGVAAWTAGEIYYTAALWDESAPPIPSFADAGFLLFPPFTFAGMLVLLRRRVRLTPTLLVDGITAALAVGALSAAIVFQTVLEHAEGDGVAVATSLAYPIADLVLLAVGVGALAAAGWRLDRTWALLVAGILAFWLADSVFLVKAAEGTFESGGWLDMAWWLALLLIALAAWQRGPSTRRRPADDSLRLLIAPLVSGAVSLELLVYASTGALNGLAVALAAAAIVFVMVRLTLTFRQNVRILRASRTEAMTDALTGLGNRRALTRALDAALPEAHEDAPRVLALFDLDGFKHYNDTFGHPAGDVLLADLGGRLRTYVGKRGRAFRMGGDEFCVLFKPSAADATALVEGAAEALSDEGEGYWVGCSFGSITLPTEADDSETALRIADQRMYACKNSGRMSAARQARDVLLAVLGPQDPGIAARAEEAALKLGLDREQREAVRYAVELHALGEDVIAAAPSLRAVARLVAESHAPSSPAARIVAAAVGRSVVA
ncbi:GGDEF domain-containing protein [Solirubrobacter sp. CPCC 204708]|uniref:GGDEF domain-containing protein n=1 Tax=Solirubrobacter deserti TaxID=2282478 RepID=A0ABT4RRD8_9ACTN|nr:GGDEF domain-containing protein [Solirubrobacter deserti]MBE2314703.1 GGDEF domain-containing protein [Solirubrobacter deserti]MDA0141020.1 GGDEF domain-containing protein [Solirubrobacter deserti]